MAYNVWGQLGIQKGMEAERYIRQSAAAGLSFANYYAGARTRGFNFDVGKMRFDYRMSRFEARAKTFEGRIKAAEFYEQRLEPIRAAHKTTLEQALKRWREIERKAQEGEDFSGEEAEAWEQYETAWYAA
jgi:hypothetical protein